MIPWVEFWHQWQFLYERCNWYDFTLIRLSVEDDRMFGQLEIEAWLLGFGIRLIWSYRETSKGQEIAKKIADFDTP